MLLVVRPWAAEAGCTFRGGSASMTQWRNAQPTIASGDTGNNSSVGQLATDLQA